jgi:O-antigen ligase
MINPRRPLAFSPAGSMKPVRPAGLAKPVPALLEYAYYGLLLNSFVLSVWLPFGSSILGAMYGLLAVICFLKVWPDRHDAYSPIALPLLCAASFIAVQVVVHGESLNGVYTRPFLVWIIQLVLVRTLCLRPRFLHRFAYVALGISVVLVPFLRVGGSGVKQAGLGAEFSMSNPNDVGRWFGFLAVCFAVAAIEKKRGFHSILCWMIAAGSFFVVAITVSRGALVAVVIAVLIAMRRILKRGFLPLVSLAMLVWIVAAMGVFERSISFYKKRAGQETGREAVWPRAVDRILKSPVIGYGASHVATYVPGRGMLTPHNCYLFIALSGGAIPLLLYAGTWIQAGRKVMQAGRMQLPDAPYLASVLVYGFLAVIPENQQFMSAWSTIIICTTLSSTALSAVRQKAVPLAKKGLYMTRPAMPHPNGMSNMEAFPPYSPVREEKK